MSRRFFHISLGILCLVIAGQANARTWYITPDGSGDAPTIQAGIDSAFAGDTVLVACGAYHDCTHPDMYGEMNCVIMKSGVCLRSETGDPDCAVIDAQGLGRVIYCDGVDNTATIEGFRITGGSISTGWPNGQGGGVFCRDNASPSISQCIVEGNWTLFDGGGMSCCWNSSPTIRDVSFEGNTAAHSAGGLMCCHPSSPVMDSCGFIGNSAVYGGGLYAGSGSVPVITRGLFSGNTGSEGGGIDCNSANITVSGCTFVGNTGTGITSVNSANPTIQASIFFGNSAGAIGCLAGGAATLSCCDVYGNPGGDWVGCIADQYGLDGNFSADPLFCDPDLGDFTLRSDSPCLPGNHPDGAACGLIGAFGEGCEGPTSIERTSWGSVKSLFR